MIEDTLHFLRICRQSHSQRAQLCNTIYQKASLNLIFFSPQSYCKILLYGCETLSNEQNKIILTSTNDFYHCNKKIRINFSAVLPSFFWPRSKSMAFCLFVSYPKIKCLPDTFYLFIYLSAIYI